MDKSREAGLDFGRWLHGWRSRSPMAEIASILGDAKLGWGSGGEWLSSAESCRVPGEVPTRMTNRPSHRRPRPGPVTPAGQQWHCAGRTDEAGRPTSGMRKRRRRENGWRTRIALQRTDRCRHGLLRWPPITATACRSVLSAGKHIGGGGARTAAEKKPRKRSRMRLCCAATRAARALSRPLRSSRSRPKHRRNASQQRSESISSRAKHRDPVAHSGGLRPETSGAARLNV